MRGGEGKQNKEGGGTCVAGLGEAESEGGVLGDLIDNNVDSITQL